MNIIRVHASKHYDVKIGSGLIAELGKEAASVIRGRHVCIVSDSNVAPLYMEKAAVSLTSEGFTVEKFVFPAGESSKSAATYIELLEFLAEKRLTRSDALVALGGGVTGDLTGFTASTYLRGIAFIQVPTTLLACVDSSVGGKTAIDLKAGKNLCGTFCQPDLVLCDTDLLATLPSSVFSEGCAEVIKYGFLGNRELIERLSAQPIQSQLEYVITTCIDMKRDVVEEDEHDTGRRQLLNLGHTFAHSIERLSGYTISHGAAVAIGMCIITRTAVRKEICPAECLDVMVQLLKVHNLPIETEFSARDLAEIALSDKKRSGSSITLVVPDTLGRSILIKTPVEELENWAEEGLHL